MRVCVGFLYPPHPQGPFSKGDPSRMEGVAGLVLVLHRGLRQVCTRNELITKPSSRQMPTKTLLSALSQSPCPSFLEGEMLNALIM